MAEDFDKGFDDDTEGRGLHFKDFMSIGIGIAALGLSLFANYTSQQAQLVSDEREMRAQLSETVDKIINLTAQNRREYQEALANNTLHLYQAQSSIMTSQVTNYARMAVFLADQYTGNISDIEFASIAQALAASFDPRADEMWQKAVEAAKSGHARAVQLNGYGQYLYTVGRAQDGRQRYDEAAAILIDNSDLSHWYNAYTHSLRATSEAMYGDLQEAQKFYQKARDTYNYIEQATVRENGLRSLNAMESETMAMVRAANSNTAGQFGQQSMSGTQ